jgi:hypothetical protein
MVAHRKQAKYFRPFGSKMQTVTHDQARSAMHASVLRLKAVPPK